MTDKFYEIEKIVDKRSNNGKVSGRLVFFNSK